MSTIFWREKRYSFIGTHRGIDHLEIYCLHYAAGSHSTCYVFISFSPQEFGNPSAYRGQAGGNEAGSHCSELESQVLSEGAATDLFQIIVARQECWPSVTTLSSFPGYLIGILKTWKHQMNQLATSWIQIGRWRETLKNVAYKGG